MANKEIIKQKSEEVKALAAKIQEAKVLILVDYKGINVADVTDLRTKLRGANTEYKIIKNNIIRRALAENKVEGLEDTLAGPTAVVLGNEDYLEPSKIIYDFAKANDYYKIKGGIIDGKVVTAEEIITLAKLPSRETLLGMLAGALLGNITKLAVGLNEVAKQKDAA